MIRVILREEPTPSAPGSVSPGALFPGDFGDLRDIREGYFETDG